jgi:hypothetical protein
MGRGRKAVGERVGPPGRIKKEDVHMCLTCGCMDAHREMGENNITYEDIKRAADENGKSVEETLRTFDRTADKDRQEHRQEYTTGTTASA